MTDKRYFFVGYVYQQKERLMNSFAKFGYFCMTTNGSYPSRKGVQDFLVRELKSTNDADIISIISMSEWSYEQYIAFIDGDV